jgi:hypothetical protein
MSVGGLAPSQRPGRVIWTAARAPSADQAIAATRSMRKRSSGRITRVCAVNAGQTSATAHKANLNVVIRLDPAIVLEGFDVADVKTVQADSRARVSDVFYSSEAEGRLTVARRR